MAILHILGAAWGPADVTGKVRSLRKNQELSVKADNSVFGDSWKGKTKTLVVVYQYDNRPPSVSIVEEDHTLTIKPPASSSIPSNPLAMEGLQKIQDVMVRTQSTKFDVKILGAAYGLADVTSKAQSFVKDGVFDAVANNATWGEGWKGKTKTLVVVYEYNGVPSMLNVVIEDQRMHFVASPALRILGASYGPADRTEQVISLVKNGALEVVANNETFGDTWPTKTKALVVIYQYGEEKPIVAIAEEDFRMNIYYKPGPGYLPSADPTNLNILGAAYGLGEVTDKVENLIKDNELDFTADNNTLGDTWKTKTKSFTLVYQYGRNQPLQTIAMEHSNVKVKKVVSPPYTGQIQTRDLLDTGDTISLSASNNKFITCDTNGKLSSVKDLPDETTTFIVEKDEKDSTLRLKTSSGKYVTIGADKFLYCNGSSSQAAKFDISLSIKAGIRLASSTTQEYARLHSDGQSIIMDAPDNFTLSTFFGIALQQTPTEVILRRHGIVLDAAFDDILTPCDTAMLSFLWSVTGGFFLAIGLGPYILTGTPKPGLLALIRSNPRAWRAVEDLVAAMQTTKGAIATVSSLLSLIGVFYYEGLLWSIFKMLLRWGAWYIVTVAIAKLLAVVLVPEAEVADRLAAFIAWYAQTVQAALNVGSVCN